MFHMFVEISVRRRHRGGDERFPSLHLLDSAFLEVLYRRYNRYIYGDVKR